MSMKEMPEELKDKVEGTEKKPYKQSDEKLTKEQYNEKVAEIVKDIETAITEGDYTKLGAIDASVRVSGGLVSTDVALAEDPKEVIKNRANHSISWMASLASNAFEKRFGETLFGMEPQGKETDKE